MRPRFRLSRSRRGATRQVLLFADNLLMAECVGEVWQVLRSDPRLRGWLAMPWIFRRQCREQARQLGVRPYYGLWRTRLQWWDLVVVASHVAPYHPAVPVVRVPHGLGHSGKMLRGQDFTYGPRRVLRPDGSPVYALMVESSEQVRDQVVTALPELADRIAVVGSLRMDRLAGLQQRSADLRAQLGFSRDDKVIMILSTFGPLSLMESVGPALVDEAARLMDGSPYRFVLSSHPNLWSVSRTRHGRWDEYLRNQRQRGFRVLEPGDDWAPYIVVSDAAVSDHTSLSLAFGYLGKPIGFMPIAPGTVADGSAVARLVAASPTLTNADELGEFLGGLLTRGIEPQVDTLAQSICTYPGEAAARLRPHLYRLLELPTS